MSSNSCTFTLHLQDLATGPLMKFAQTGQSAFNSLDKTANALQSKVKGINSLSGGLAGITGLVGKLAGGFAVFETVKGIGQMAIDAEQTHVAFTTMLGSTQKATAALSDLKKFSKATPFESEEVTKSGRSLLAFGFQVQELLPNLKAVGDVAAGTQVPLTDLATIFGKARVAGRLYAEDINQLTERGVPIIDELAKVFNTSSGEVKKLVEQGKVGFPQLQQAFASMSGEGGRFFNLMAKQSATVGGKWSSLVDTAKELGLGIGNQLLPVMGGFIDFTNGLLENIRPVQDALAGVWRATQPLRDAFASVAERMGIMGNMGGFAQAVMSGLGRVIEWVTPFAGTLASVFGTIVESIANVTGSIIGFINSSEGLQKFLSGFAKAFTGAFQAIGEIAKNVFGGIGDLITGIFSGDLDIIKSGIGKLGEGIKGQFFDLPKSIAENFMQGEAFQIGMNLGKPAGAGADSGLAGMSGISSIAKMGTGGGGGKGTSGLGAGIAGVAGDARAAKSIVININGGLMSGNMTFHTTNIKESAAKIEEALTAALIKSVHDAEMLAA